MEREAHVSYAGHLTTLGEGWRFGEVVYTVTGPVTSEMVDRWRDGIKKRHDFYRVVILSIYVLPM